MIHQPLANKKGGTVAVIDYMLNEREEKGMARVLKGSPLITRKIVNTIPFKQKLLAGVLSFEEKNIDADEKMLIMRSFEKALLPGMGGRYNILWVEHLDKGRLELNYMIPKIDLQTQKSLNCYYDFIDRARVEVWRDTQNHIFRLSDPSDPFKKQILKNDKRVKFIKDYKKLNEFLLELVTDRKIINREHLIGTLNQCQIIVEKIAKSFLIIKLPKSKNGRKFTGGIYSEEFRSLESIEGIYERECERVEQYTNRDSSKEFRCNIQKRDNYTREKEEYLRKRYGKSYQDFEERNNEINRKYRKRVTKNIKKRTKRNSSDTKGKKFVESNLYNWNNVLYDNLICSINNDNSFRETRRGKQNLLFLDDREEQINDKYRADIDRIRRKRDFNLKFLQRIREERRLLFERNEKSNENLRAEYSVYERRIREEYEEHQNGLRKDYQRDKEGLSKFDLLLYSDAKRSYQGRRSFIRQGGIILEAIESITRTITFLREGNEENQRKIEDIRSRYTRNNILEKKLNDTSGIISFSDFLNEDTYPLSINI